MTNLKILHRLGLDELIGTDFETFMNVIKIKKKDTIYYSKDKEMSAIYVLEGKVQYIVYSPEGREFYIDYFPGDLAGIGATLSHQIKNKMKRSFEADLVGKEDSIIVTLPFGKIFNMKFEGKEEFLKKLIFLFAEEHFQVSEYFFHKSLYSEESFFIKIIEKHKTIDKSTRELSEMLNINLRTLQRIIKNLQKFKVIIKENNKISLGEKKNIDKYKMKFEN